MSYEKFCIMPQTLEDINCFLSDTKNKTLTDLRRVVSK